MLGGGQLQVEDHQIRLHVAAKLCQLLQPSASQAGGFVRGFPLLHQGAQHLRPRRMGQFLQLGQRSLHVVFSRIQGDQDSLFRLFFKNSGFHCATPFQGEAIPREAYRYFNTKGMDIAVAFLNL